MIYIIIGLGIICLILGIYLIKQHSKINDLVYKLAQKVTIDTTEAQEYETKLQNLNNQLNQKNNELKQEAIRVIALQDQQQSLKNSIDIIQEQQKQAAKNVYAAALETAEKSFDDEITRISSTLEKERENARISYISLMNEYCEDFQQKKESIVQELQSLNSELNNLQKIVDTAVEAQKREEQKKDNLEFFRLQLSTDDLEEIKKLREVLPYLRDKEPLNKVIYKVYYEKPYSALVGRVLGQTVHIGIYKITNINNGMCYVGQAVNVAERWRQHIKRGVGAEPTTRNKLYPAMMHEGVENFTFELIEDCNRNELDAREDFWQKYFHTIDYGYSIK